MGLRETKGLFSRWGPKPGGRPLWRKWRLVRQAGAMGEVTRWFTSDMALTPQCSSAHGDRQRAKEGGLYAETDEDFNLVLRKWGDVERSLQRAGNSWAGFSYAFARPSWDARKLWPVTTFTQRVFIEGAAVAQALFWTVGTLLWTRPSHDLMRPTFHCGRHTLTLIKMTNKYNVISFMSINHIMSII